MKRHTAFVVALGFAAAAEAQAPVPAPPAPFPVIDPASALRGPAMIDALRNGGYVLVMRHARQSGPQDAAACTRPNLGPEGEAQAKRLGSVLRRLRVPIGKVLASTVCRAIETARLLELGEVETTEDLNPGSAGTPELHAARLRRLAAAPSPGTNTIVVSHIQTSVSDAERLLIEHAEIVVYRPDGKGGTTPVARIKLEDWEALASVR